MLAEMLKEERAKKADHAGRSQNDAQYGYGIQEMSDDQAASKFPENLEKKQAFLTADEMEMLAEMEEEANAPEEVVADEGCMANEEEEAAVANEEMVLGEDPMGLDADEDAMMADDEDLLANLFGEKFAADEEEEEEAEEEEAEEDADEEEGDDDGEEEEKEEKKASRLRPTPRKAGKGVKTLGSVKKSAAANELNELANLWETAPDVSNIFK